MDMNQLHEMKEHGIVDAINEWLSDTYLIEDDNLALNALVEIFGSQKGHIVYSQHDDGDYNIYYQLSDGTAILDMWISYDDVVDCYLVISLNLIERTVNA